MNATKEKTESKMQVTEIIIDKCAHPGSGSVKMAAGVKITEGTKVSVVWVPITAEKDRFKDDKFAVRLTVSYVNDTEHFGHKTEATYNLKKTGITGLGSVTGLGESARAAALTFWQSDFLPDHALPLVEETFPPTFKPVLKDSRTLLLEFNDARIGKYFYDGGLEYKVNDDGELKPASNQYRWGATATVKDDGTERNSLNPATLNRLALYLQPLAAMHWQQSVGAVKQKRVDELNRTIQNAHDEIESARYTIQESERKLTEAEKELKTIQGA